MAKEKSEMTDFKNVLTPDELAVYTLRALYADYGYTQYKMSKFEEYDLYMRNKEFLVSDNVITFTDTDGRLLALKPDVTLSIVKNSRDGDGLIKAQYNENVYRVSSGTHSFKEIMQVGLECIGEVGEAEICEVLTLAAKSLDAFSESSVLEISDTDIVLGTLDELGVSEDGVSRIFKLLSQKNLDGVLEVCSDEGVSDEGKALISKLVTLYGSPATVLSELGDLGKNERARLAIERLTRIVKTLCDRGLDNKLCIDFSVSVNRKYYNGISFKGFIEGIPVSILSGGQYDNLMKSVGRKSRAIGFAVYLDELERLPGR
jgi:ATP phosphoribosyltransferase regulatory subunit